MLSNSEWDSHVAAWSSPPVDDVGYMSSRRLLQQTDKELISVVRNMRSTRYNGWRNYQGKWRDIFGLDSTSDKDILDYGCGVGIEALEFSDKNRVSIADISSSNIALAERVLKLHGILPVHTYLISNQSPYIQTSHQFDIFYCNGVLHHIRHPRPIIERAHQILRPGGELRLMVYSDEGWRYYMACEPPEHTDDHPLFESFVRTFDQVGNYADWYSIDKINRLFGDLFEIKHWTYLTPNNRYLGASLIKRD